MEERNREEGEKWRGHVTKREAYLELRVVAFRLLAIRQFLLHRQQLWLSLRSSVPELHRHGFRLEVLRRIDARQHRASPRWFRDYYFRSIRPRRVAILETRKGILLPPLFLSQLNKILLESSLSPLFYQRRVLGFVQENVNDASRSIESRPSQFPSSRFVPRRRGRFSSSLPPLK